MLAQIRKIGWFVVEAMLVLVAVCVLLNIILGRESGAFISGVAANALELVQRVPPGTFLGVVLILVLAGLLRARA
jgi:hypothetical protein